jgi:hypothetical protein
MNRNIVFTCLALVTGISIVGHSSEVIESAWAQTTMGNGMDGNTTAQGNTTAGAPNMTNSNATGSGKISACPPEGC